MRTKEVPLAKPTPDEKEGLHIRQSFLSGLEADIASTRAQIVLSTSEAERNYHSDNLKNLYRIKETYGK